MPSGNQVGHVQLAAAVLGPKILNMAMHLRTRAWVARMYGMGACLWGLCLAWTERSGQQMQRMCCAKGMWHLRAKGVLVRRQSGRGIVALKEIAERTCACAGMPRSGAARHPINAERVAHVVCGSLGGSSSQSIWPSAHALARGGYCAASAAHLSMRVGCPCNAVQRPGSAIRAAGQRLLQA